MANEEQPAYRIISGEPETVEREVNLLVENYSPVMFNIHSSEGKPLVTCIMIHEREVRKAQIAAMRQATPMMLGPRH